ncbi:pyrroline-5-carboxylate reductase [Curvibacter sp. RS43]|jgi:pyrroline-5-carboxylate reductase|uniref:pyrroline-5-carboxylate reductase n=1 Tax=Curvibacter microcysteis TaxID=3026419 RepID=UPI00235E370D|nr:pyrroline-5-carboxylate reductase [Curvibacter sp. RS43]MDD0811674.1 pyrroline-5-carboxylate reductase [Curvibacter sp. RS43]
MTSKIAFIGGGNMASAIIGGLLKQGLKAADILVVEPFAEARERLARDLGVHAQEVADARLAQAGLVVWAVKPQTFRDAAAAVQAHATGALHLSVAAGIRSDSIAAWLGTERVVRCMPNTPALVGKGMTGLFARAAVTDADRQQVEQVIRTTGDLLWVAQETQLDAVTALSGSGPAYVFYFIEAMAAAGAQMGLSPEQSLQLAIGTFVGAADLAQASTEGPEVLRQRVTSKGGTTYAALSSMEESRIKEHFMLAMEKARARAVELGNEFGTV